MQMADVTDSELEARSSIMMRWRMTQRPAVILLSGGLDSATVLAIARDSGFACHALSFDYGQRHRHELEAARRVAESIGVAEHRIATIDLRAFGGSALTADIAVPKQTSTEHRVPSTEFRKPGADSRQPRAESTIPITYVPARNTIFLSFALGYAEVLDATDIFIGVNAVDYSGYPDCRPAFIEAFQKMANLATKIGVEHAERHEEPIRIHTPLMHMSKAEIIRQGAELGVDYGLTMSCYDPRDDGSPCGECDACHLRAEGFREAGVIDPLIGA
jgi:7-cyano-7-deazaguanine synthase